MLGTKLFLAFGLLLVAVEAQNRRYDMRNRLPFRRQTIRPRPSTTVRPIQTTQTVEVIPPDSLEQENDDIDTSQMLSTPRDTSEEPESEKLSLTIVYPENYHSNPTSSRHPVYSGPRLLNHRPNIWQESKVGLEHDEQTTIPSPTSSIQKHLRPRPPSLHPATQPPSSPPTTLTPKTAKPIHIWQPKLDDTTNPNMDIIESSEYVDYSEITVRPSIPKRPNLQSQKNPMYASPVKPKTSSRQLKIPSTRPTIRSTTATPTREPQTIQKSFKINQLQDYICKDLEGYEAIPSKCDAYIECRRNLAFENMCPDGLHFNPAARYPDYPCAYPSEVKCPSFTDTQKPQPNGQCPHLYGFYPMPSSDCSKYLMCQEGIATIMKCPPGLVFSSTTSSCDWPANVPGCSPDVFEGFTCPANSDQQSQIIFKYRFKSSCTQYIACHKGHPRLLSCDMGMYFDSESSSCVDADQVLDCQE